MTAKTVKKSVSQFSFPVDDEQWNILNHMAGEYCSCRNYVWSRYSGIHSISLVHDKNRFWKEVRDAWSGKDAFGSQWDIPARMRNLALDDAKAKIKGEWSNTKNRVRVLVKENENLTDDERGYIYYILQANPLLEDILCHRPVERPDSIRRLNVREPYVHNLIRRYIRRCKGHIPHSSSTTFQIDPDMYDYVQKEDGLYLEFSSPERRQRIVLKVRDNQIHKKTLTVVLHQESHTVEIHALKSVKTKKVSAEGRRKTRAIDKGYTDLLACSSGNIYGKGIHKLMTAETEAQNEKLAKRNRIYAQIKACEEAGDYEKAERIRKNNFGRKKWNSQRRKARAHLESEINHAIREMIQKENPNRIILEKLNFTAWYKKMSPGTKRKLARWVKGYLDERLVYICSLFQIETVHVNAAYTSQTCSKCGCLGERRGKNFFCPHCGHKEDADINASKVIEIRWKDPEIDLYTPHKEVKRILKERTRRYEEKHSSAAVK